MMSNLKELLCDTSSGQFWIKPWGSRDFPDQPDAQPGTQFVAAPQVEITFAKSKNPPSIQEGDMFLIYHVRMAHMDAPKFVCVTEANSTPSYATAEPAKRSLVNKVGATYPRTKPNSDMRLEGVQVFA